MRNTLVVLGCLVIGATAGAFQLANAQMASDTVSVARYAPDGRLIRPDGWRTWIYVGTPLTPNDMNNGKAPFPEFHSVYIEPRAYAIYRRTGRFPDGTMLVKELISVGSKEAASGKGYFMGEFIGFEVAIKDAKRYPKAPGGWAYYSFGHHKPPYAKLAKAQKHEACSACHQANAADDFVFTQYYPVLRAARPKR